MKYQKAEFLTSAAKLSQLPEDSGAEVAFVGRSNAGKSSSLNALTRQKNLARTSKTPGRTQLINLFQLDELRRLVDLPGFGYAKVPEKMRKSWEKVIDGYLTERECLRAVVLIMDIRHPLKNFDLQMIEWAEQAGLPIHVLLNKADKLKFGEQKKTLLQVQQKLKAYQYASVQIFSAEKKNGLEELEAKLNNWFE
jgi:GTP-binding protein